MCSVGYRVILELKLTQHSRDENLLLAIRDNLDCGGVYKNRNAFDYRVTKFADILGKIIPLFKKYRIRGVKEHDFCDFCRAAELMELKKHLTEDGLEEIRQIKAGMNRGRKF